MPDMPPGKKIIVSFAVTRELFGSGFSNGHHDAFMEIKHGINTVLNAAEEVRLTCPAGTDVTGRPEMNLRPGGDPSILRFPMSVFTLVRAYILGARGAVGVSDRHRIEILRPLHDRVRRPGSRADAVGSPDRL